RLLTRGHGDPEVVGRTELRLVPAGEETPRVRRLELGEQRALRSLVALIVEREQAGRLGVDRAGIIEGQPIAARGETLAETEGRRLRVGVNVGVDGIERQPGRVPDRDG